MLDTNVISMLSPARAEASARFLEWLERVDGEGRVFLLVVAMNEIEKGVALLEHKAASLKVWPASLGLVAKPARQAQANPALSLARRALSRAGLAPRQFPTLPSRRPAG